MSISFFSTANRIIISRLLATLLFLTLGVSLTGWQQLEPFLEHSLSLIGWVFIAVATMGRVWCSSYIGGNKNSVLVTVGPYSVCRNPLYFCSFVGGLGVMLVTETLLLPFVFCVVYAGYYSNVIAAEEETLLKIHGARFEAYCSQVPRFWPRFSLFSEPANCMISAAQFRKSLTEAVWFIIAGGVIEYLEGLHVSGYLPVYLYIY